MKYLLLAAICLLAACVADPHHSSAADVPPEKIDPKVVEQKNAQLHLELIREMVDKGQDYAALAHIQDLKQHGDNDEQVILLEADCRRHLGQVAESDQQYRRLLNGPLAGQAYHGMGLLYVRTNPAFALTSLRRASQLVPTDADIRNDYGRALMEAGRYNEAMPELSTASELAPDQKKSRKNLIVLMMLLRNEPAATQLAQQSAIDGNEMQKLREQALRIRSMQTSKPAATG
jgi:Flp pilus assembly protein TadD